MSYIPKNTLLRTNTTDPQTINNLEVAPGVLKAINNHNVYWYGSISGLDNIGAWKDNPIIGTNFVTHSSNDILFVPEDQYHKLQITVSGLYLMHVQQLVSVNSDLYYCLKIDNDIPSYAYINNEMRDLSLSIVRYLTVGQKIQIHLYTNAAWSTCSLKTWEGSHSSAYVVKL